METAEYELIVVGAGPAGSACAITAARLGAKVLLLEKDSFPRQKVCGEFVSSESLGLLHGLLQNDLFCPAPVITSSRIFLDQKVLTFPVSPAAQSIPRFNLDAALFQAAQHTGISVAEETLVTEVQRDDVRDKTRLFRVKSSEKSFTSLAVINTTGRWSKLTQFDVAGQEKWLGLKAHFSEQSPLNSVDLYFFPGGYCGVTPVSTDSINACAMVRADVGHTLEEVFAKEPRLWERSRSWKALFPTVTTSPLYFHEPQIESHGMLLAGDAAGFIDPFAGDGISLALQSGALAAKSIVSFLHGGCSLEQAHEQYRTAYRARFFPAFRNAARLRSALAAPKWIRSTVFAFAGLPGIGKMLVRGTRARSA